MYTSAMLIAGSAIFLATMGTTQGLLGLQCRCNDQWQSKYNGFKADLLRSYGVSECIKESETDEFGICTHGKPEASNSDNVGMMALQTQLHHVCEHKELFYNNKQVRETIGCAVVSDKATDLFGTMNQCIINKVNKARKLYQTMYRCDASNCQKPIDETCQLGKENLANTKPRQRFMVKIRQPTTTD